MNEPFDAEKRSMLLTSHAAWRASLTEEFPEGAMYEAERPAMRTGTERTGGRFPAGARADLGVQEVVFTDDDGKEVRMLAMAGMSMEQAKEMHRQEKRRLAGRSNLAVAIDAGDAAAVRRLIAGGTDPKATDKDSRGRPIGWIARAGFTWSGRSHRAGGDRAAEVRLADAYAAIIRALLAAGADPSMTWQGYTPLQALPKRQPSGERTPHLLALVRELLQEGATLEPGLSNHVAGPLAHAATLGDRELVELLVREGRPTQAMLDGALEASFHQSWSGAALLLRLGADPNTRIGPGRTSLLEATNRGVRNDLVRALIERKVDPNVTLGGGQTPLMRAVRAPEILEALLELGAGVDAVHATDGYTALHLAAASKPPSMASPKGALPDVLAATRDRAVEILLRHGAKPDAADKSGATPLMWTSNEDGPAIERLLDAGARLPARVQLGPAPDEPSVGPVTAALLRGNETLALAWLRRNPRLSTEDCAAMYVAASRGAAEVVSLLARQPPRTVHEPWSGHTPLIAAASMGHVAAIDALVATRAAKVDERSEVENVHISLGHGGVEMLLAIPAAKLQQVERRRKESGVTPLMAAARNGRVEAVIALLRAGATPDLVDGYGRTALDHAEESRSPRRQQVIDVLVARGAKRAPPRS